MSELIHKTDGGFMGKYDNGVKMPKMWLFFKTKQNHFCIFRRKDSVAIPFRSGKNDYVKTFFSKKYMFSST